MAKIWQDFNEFFVFAEKFLFFAIVKSVLIICMGMQGGTIE